MGGALTASRSSSYSRCDKRRAGSRKWIEFEGRALGVGRGDGHRVVSRSRTICRSRPKTRKCAGNAREGG